MSERMIEMHRARLMAVKGAKSSVQSTSTQQIGQVVTSGRGIASGLSFSNLAATLTPQQSAVNSALLEDSQMKIFFEKLQDYRDDSNAESISGPTVPTALTRRILQQQGVGYLDTTVGAVASAMADRFLATILQQAAACRDQRLKGAELTQKAARQRRMHKRQYNEDVDDRIRRKLEKAQRRERVNLTTIQAAESIKFKGAVSKDTTKEGEQIVGSKSKKKKKVTSVDTPFNHSYGNGNKLKEEELTGEGTIKDEDDSDSFDSVDEEEEYYQNYYNDCNSDDSDAEEEMDEDEMLILRDLERPLAVWDFSVKGKIGLDPMTDLVGNNMREEVLEDSDNDEDGIGSENELTKTADENDDDDVRQGGKKDDSIFFSTSSNEVKSPADESNRATKKRNASSPVP